MKKKMRTLRLFLILFTLTLSVNIAYSQSNENAYKKHFVKLLESEMMGNHFDPSLFKDAFIPVAAEFVGQEKAESKVNEYLKKYCMEDCIEVLLPYFTDSLSLDDVKFLGKYCDTPKGRLAAKHAAELNKSSYTEVEELGTSVMMSLMLDVPVDPVETVNCPASYREIYNEYYEKTSADKMVSDIIKVLETTLGTEVTNTDDESVRMIKKAIKGYGDYMSKNFKEILLSCCYGLLTEDDLKFYVGLVTTPAGRKYMNCASKLTEDPEKLGVAIISKFVIWIQK
jgi:hypothetical protein